MKTTLDLTTEFAALDDTKSRCRGKLPPADERRWAELKLFYNVLMAQEGFPSTASAPGFTAADIRERVRPRERLRVGVESEVVVVYQCEHHIADLVNLSCGGALLATPVSLQGGAPLSLCFTSFPGVRGPILTVEAEVVWRNEAGLSVKAGVRFVDLPSRSLDLLDAFVLENLEKRLFALCVAALEPGFAAREQLVKQVGQNRFARRG